MNRKNYSGKVDSVLRHLKKSYTIIEDADNLEESSIQIGCFELAKKDASKKVD